MASKKKKLSSTLLGAAKMLTASNVVNSKKVTKLLMSVEDPDGLCDSAEIDSCRINSVHDMDAYDVAYYVEWGWRNKNKPLLLAEADGLYYFAGSEEEVLKSLEAAKKELG